MMFDERGEPTRHAPTVECELSDTELDGAAGGFSSKPPEDPPKPPSGAVPGLKPPIIQSFLRRWRR